jgi:hypothetical protein
MIPGGTAFPWRMIGGALTLAASTGGATWLIQKARRKSTALSDAGLTAAGTLTALGLWEATWYLYRWNRRRDVYREAALEAKRLNRQLVVIGAPDGGMTSGYGCGDVTVDLSPSSCPNWKPLDITKQLPFADNSVVVFISCVLEYVSDPMEAIQEVQRISGGYVYYVGVEPWTLTAFLYPSAKQALPPAYR